jgi:hypothetical protein
VQPLPVAGAGEALVADVDGGQRQRQRQPSQVGGEFVALVEPVWAVAEAPAQVGGGLLVGEHPDVDQVPAVEQRGVPAAAGDHSAPGGGVGWPQPGQVLRVAEVVEHDQPPLVRAGQPGQQSLGGRLPVRVLGPADVRGGLRVGVHDAVAATGGDPDQQVDGLGLPQLLGQVRRQLGLADPAHPRHDLTHHRRPATGHRRGQHVIGGTPLPTVSRPRHRPPPSR